jgi:hypothetical protein
MAALFIKSAIFAGCLDAGGMLKTEEREAVTDTTPPKRTEPDPITHSDPHEFNILTSSPPMGTHTHTLPLANKRKVTVNAPLDINPQEIARIQKWIEVTLLVDWLMDDKTSP